MVEKNTEEIINVPGVKKATVLITKNQVFIGLSLEENISTEKETAIKREIRYRIRMFSTDLVKIYITSQLDLVLRLENIIEQINKGKKISELSLELSALTQMMVENERS